MNWLEIRLGEFDLYFAGLCFGPVAICFQFLSYLDAIDLLIRFALKCILNLSLPLIVFLLSLSFTQSLVREIRP